MGRIKRGGYLIEWWMGDHDPKHIHVYEHGKEVAKIQIPGLIILSGKLNKKLKRILKQLMQEGRL